MNVLTLVRTAAATILAIVLSGVALHLGPEPHSITESIGITGILGGPGFLILGYRLAKYAAEQREKSRKFRATLVPLGMALGLLNMIAVLLLAVPFITWWALVLPVMFFFPALAGGAGLGLGCMIGDR